MKDMKISGTQIFLLISISVYSQTVETLLVVVVYAKVQGIEVVARSCELIGPIVYGVVLVLIVLLFSDVKFRYLLPVCTETGWLPIVKGAVTRHCQVEISDCSCDCSFCPSLLYSGKQYGISTCFAVKDLGQVYFSDEHDYDPDPDPVMDCPSA